MKSLHMLGDVHHNDVPQDPAQDPTVISDKDCPGLTIELIAYQEEGKTNWWLCMDGDPQLVLALGRYETGANTEEELEEEIDSLRGLRRQILTLMAKLWVARRNTQETTDVIKRSIIGNVTGTERASIGDALVIDAVAVELGKARRKFADMHGPHEAYAVIKEELDEYWEALRAKPGSIKHSGMREELIQTAAMCIRAVVDLELFVEEDES